MCDVSGCVFFVVRRRSLKRNVYQDYRELNRNCGVYVVKNDYFRASTSAGIYKKRGLWHSRGVSPCPTKTHEIIVQHPSHARRKSGCVARL